MHPLEHVPGALQFFVGIDAAVLAGFGLLIMGAVGRVMSTRGANIIDFEVAGNERRLREILDSWGIDGKTAARQSLLADTFLFVPGYAVLAAIIAAGCAQEVGFRTTAFLGDVTRVAAWLALAAGALDLVENVALGFVLDGRVAMGHVARVCAYVKFVAIGAAAAWLILFVLPVVASPSVPL
jgi:hypothetical protein